MEKESRYASSREIAVDSHFLLSTHLPDRDLTVAISALRFSQIANQNGIFCTKCAVSALNVPETAFR
ncbi:TPA: hypothetical protein I7693_09625 [Vibrio vulnificus]|nr:hypothetical protein [Vibrio vulnificus]HAS8207872.1 hypothetical protein [Vibrio vulnificus]HAS8328183.1 hypothetical protein [Vibrio vulnificus]